MSFGQIVGGVVGAVIGYYLGGPTGMMMGASLGSGIGGIVDPLEPDIPSPGQPDIANLDMTTAQEGAVIVDFVGTSKMAGNIFYYSNSRVMEVKEEQETGGKGGSSSKEVTVGLEYFLTWAIGLSVGPVDELYTVLSNDKVVWSGNLLRSEAVDGKSTITLEGMGSMTFYFGTDDQTAETVIGDDVGTDVNPPYRGLCWAFFNDVSLGDYNRAPTVRFVMRKTPDKAFSANNIINTYDYNPAHAIWYILEDMCELDTSWLSTSYFSSFALANVSSDESHGVSILFKHAEAMQYINSILQHVQGIMPFGDDTGQFEPKLLRSDQAVSALTLITDDDCLEPPMVTSQSYMDTFNDVKVQYSQIYEFETGTPVTSGVSFNPNETYNYVGIAATDKFNTYFLGGDTGGGNKPAANGTRLNWEGAKLGNGNGEETYSVVSNGWWFPAGQKKYEIEFTVDYDSVSTGVGPQGSEPLRVGICANGGSAFNPNADEGLIIMNGNNSGPLVTANAGIGNTNSVNVSNPLHWPMRFRVRNERHPSNNTAKSGIMFYNGVLGQWQDFWGTVDNFYFGIYETSVNRYLYQRFSTDTSTGNPTNAFTGGVQSYTITQGAVTCVDSSVYSDQFTGVGGGTIDLTKWEIAELTTGSAASIAPIGGSLRLTCGIGSSPNEAVIRHLVEPTGSFAVSIQTANNLADPGGTARTFSGVRLVDSVTGERWEVGYNFGNGSTLSESRIWDGSTYNTLYSESVSNVALLYEIERYGNAGSIDIRVSNDLTYAGSVSDQINTTNPLYIELFKQSGSAATDSSFFETDTFNFIYLERGDCPTVPETGAIDIRQATVHAEDPGNKEVLNRIRHKDERMMLFTRDSNARWGAGQVIRTTSIPLRLLEMKMDRRGIFFPPGENFRYKSDKYGITKETVFRVLSVREGNLDKEEYTVNAIEDANYLASLVVVDEADREGSRINPFLVDIQNADILEAPYSMVGQEMYLVPLIGRKNGNETGYHLYMSNDGSSYSKQASVSSFVTAGCLAATLNNSLADLDNTNTLKVDFFYDQDAQDITSISRADLIAGKNLAVLVNGATQEIIGFENITPDGAVTGRYSMTNLYRGRYDTDTYQWPSNSKFYYIGTAPPLVHMPALVKGNTRYFKFIFYNTLKAGDISAADAIQKQIVGRAWTPYQPGGFRANNASENTPGGPVYTSGISLQWNPEIRGTGAGRQDPDVVVDSEPTWEGFFEVVGLISGATAFTDTAINAATAAYTEGEIKSWNGGTLPSQITFKLTNYITTDGVKYQSAYNTLTVNKGN